MKTLVGAVCALGLALATGCGGDPAAPVGPTLDGGVDAGVGPAVDGGAVVDGGTAADGGAATDGGEADGGTGTLVLLPGAGDALASDAVTNFAEGDILTEGEISVDALGRSVARTQFEIVLRSTATTAEANALLVKYGASIVSSVAGVAAVVTRIPDPATLAALDALVAQIEAEPIVWFVQKGFLPENRSLPDPYPADSSLRRFLQHLIPVRAPAAWNAAGAIRVAPQVTVSDDFGDGVPNVNFDYENKGVSGDFRAGALNSHGYGVLGVICATHGGGSDGNFAPLSTGVFPATIALRVLDGTYVRTLAARRNAIIFSLNQTTGKVVLNTSWGEQCTETEVSCRDLDEARRTAVVWIRKVRANNLEGQVLHVTAAQNNRERNSRVGMRDAETDAVFSSAALLRPLLDENGHTVANLSNTLVVENVWPTEDPPYEVWCTNSTSFSGGNIAGIGTEVSTLGNHGTSYLGAEGTSYATPQVAGVAAYLLSIRSEMTPQEVIGLLQATARHVPRIDNLHCSNAEAQAPIIDAYDAVLGLDTELTPTGAPVRMALLDVTGDKLFREDDLQQFADAYQLSSGGPAASEPPDYGRFDLNGDGLTGNKTATTSIDLNLAGSERYGAPVYGTVEQMVAGTPVSFDERALTDLQILCYYAYSPLYSGDAGLRDSLLSPHCKRSACCTLAGACSMTTAFSCTTAGDTPAAGNCGQPDPCASLTQACCVSGGTQCQEMSTADCALAGGTLPATPKRTCADAVCEPVSRWTLVRSDDCGFYDVRSSSGSATPVESYCDAAFSGKIAICWNGNHSDFPGTQFCTYKDRTPENCTGGSHPGEMYVCQ